MLHIINIAHGLIGHITPLTYLPAQWHDNEGNTWLVRNLQEGQQIQDILSAADYEGKAVWKQTFIESFTHESPRDLVDYFTDYGSRHLVFYRLAKDAQQSYINSRIAAHYGTSEAAEFRKIVGSRFGMRTMVPDSGANFWLVKPVYGARGIGFIKFDPTVVSGELIYRTLFVPNREPQQVYDSLVKLHEKFGPSFQYIAGRENSELEGVSALLEGSYMCEMVEDVAREFRLITNAYGQICYVLERNRRVVGGSDTVEGLGMLQATGHSSSLQNAVWLTQEEVELDKGFTHDSRARNELFELGSMDEVQNGASNAMDFIESSNAFRSQSIDLFVCKDGRFGIFEFQAQFGSTSVPAEVGLMLGKSIVE